MKVAVLVGVSLAGWKIVAVTEGVTVFVDVGVCVSVGDGVMVGVSDGVALMTSGLEVRN